MRETLDFHNNCNICQRLCLFNVVATICYVFLHGCFVPFCSVKKKMANENILPILPITTRPDLIFQPLLQSRQEVCVISQQGLRLHKRLCSSWLLSRVTPPTYLLLRP